MTNETHVEERAFEMEIDIDASPEDVWNALTKSSREVFPIAARSLQPGSAYVVDAATGDRFSGAIELSVPDREFAGTADELHDGIFRLSTYPAHHRTGIVVWAATYDDSTAPGLHAFQARAQALLEKIFPGAR